LWQLVYHKLKSIYTFFFFSLSDQSQKALFSLLKTPKPLLMAVEEEVMKSPPSSPFPFTPLILPPFLASYEAQIVSLKDLSIALDDISRSNISIGFSSITEGSISAFTCRYQLRIRPFLKFLDLIFSKSDLFTSTSFTTTCATPLWSRLLPLSSAISNFPSGHHALKRVPHVPTCGQPCAVRDGFHRLLQLPLVTRVVMLPPSNYHRRVKTTCRLVVFVMPAANV